MRRCAVSGCEKRHSARGFCKTHYERARIAGEFKGKEITLAERLRLNSRVNETTGCIEWTGPLSNKGYGKIGTNWRTVGAHRVALELSMGQPIPKGKCVLHSCDNPRCVNPKHLSIGTLADNSGDMVKKGRQMHGVGHYRAKLNEDDVLSIRKDSRTQVVIASDYCVSYSLISAIKRRRLWRHVP